MALTYVGQSDSATNTVTLPSFQAGDLAVFFAYRDGSNTVPSAATGTTDIGTSGGANTNSRRTAWRRLVTGDTTFQFANATGVSVMVFRGAKAASSPIGASSSGGSNTTTLTSPALTVNDTTSGQAALLFFAGTKSTDANAKTLPGATATVNGSATALAKAYLLNNTANYSATNWSSVVNASANRLDTIEILAEPTSGPFPDNGTAPTYGMPVMGSGVQPRIVGRGRGPFARPGFLPGITFLRVSRELLPTQEPTLMPAGTSTPVYTGSAICTVGAVTASASATFSPGTKTATVACTVAHATASAAGTFTKPTYTGAASCTVGPVTASLAGTFSPGTKTATVACTVAPVTASADAAFTKPTYTGSVIATIAPVTASVSGTVTNPTFTGSAAGTAAPATASGTAVFATAVFLASGSATIGPATASAAATFTKPTYTGTGALATAPATASASGTFTTPTFTGAGSANTGAATAEGVATFTGQTFSGAAAVTAGPATASLTGTFTEGEVIPAAWRIFRMHVTTEVLVPMPVTRIIVAEMPVTREVIVAMPGGG